MKKLKKFAALLLVGVMALALLTACGGGGDGMVTDKDEENKVKSRISQDHGNIAVTNDEGLRAIAEGHLNMDRKNLNMGKLVHLELRWKMIGSSPSPPGITIRIPF